MSQASRPAIPGKALGLAEIGEFGFIESIRPSCLVRPDNVLVPIGDDAAVFRVPHGRVSLLSTDLLLEGVHFLRHAAPPADLGHKALAVNLSDIAAMGGVPADAFVSLGVPSDISLEFLREFYRGMTDLARRFGVNILGGDTTTSRAGLVINVAITGTAGENQFLRRDGAKAGDLLAVTGPLGDSRAGLHYILNGLPPDTDEARHVYTAHVRPMPHVDEGRFLVGDGVRAGLDVSDGLAGDLGHVAKASGVGLRLFAARIPLSLELRAVCARLGQDPLTWALSGGEDYVLACALPAATALETATAFAARFGRPLHLIGETTADPSVRELTWPDGRSLPLGTGGWDHFRPG